MNTNRFFLKYIILSILITIAFKQTIVYSAENVYSTNKLKFANTIGQMIGYGYGALKTFSILKKECDQRSPATKTALKTAFINWEKRNKKIISRTKKILEVSIATTTKLQNDPSNTPKQRAAYQKDFSGFRELVPAVEKAVQNKVLQIQDKQITAACQNLIGNLNSGKMDLNKNNKVIYNKIINWNQPNYERILLQRFK